MRPTRVQIPEELKSDVPHTTWGKILSATPVIMAVVATMLAGLSSSEMTRAQYDRALAAQQQSKAGDQWSFFQAKRLRGAFQQSTLDLLQGLAPAPHFQESVVQEAMTSGADDKQRQDLAKFLATPEAKQTMDLLSRGALPSLPPAPALPADIKEALDALQSPAGESKALPLLARIKPAAVETAVRQAKEQSVAMDDLLRPINKGIDQLDAALRPMGQTGEGPGRYKQFHMARLKFTALRYEAEARLNQGIASLNELQVKLSNISAERHHIRSQRFFFGMLAAQAGVIISTFAMAARKRNILWSIAAGAGLIAIAFAIYVYLYV